MGRRASPSPNKMPGFLGLPLRVFAQEVGEQRCANPWYHTHVCARKLRQTAGARTSRNVPLGVRADPVGTPLRERLHPQDAPSRQHWRNIVAHVKQRTDAPETARPMRYHITKNTKSCSARHRRAEAARAATRESHVCEKAATRKTKSCAKGQRVRQRTAPSGNA